MVPYICCFCECFRSKLRSRVVSMEWCIDLGEQCENVLKAVYPVIDLVCTLILLQKKPVCTEEYLLKPVYFLRAEPEGNTPG